MAGFGNTVAKGIQDWQERSWRSDEAKKERTYQEEQDAFKMYYNTFNDELKQKREWEREDRERVKNSETISQVTGFDPTAVYSLLGSGYTASQIMQMREDGYEIQDIVDSSQGNVNKPVDKPQDQTPAGQQTQQMLGTGQPNNPQNPASKYDTNKFNERIAAATGRPIQEVEATMRFDPSADNKTKSRALDVRWKIPTKKNKAVEGPSSVAELVRGIVAAQEVGDTKTEALLTKQLTMLQQATAKEGAAPNSIEDFVSVIQNPNSTPEQKAWAENGLKQLRSIKDEQRAQDIRTNLELRGEVPPQGLGMVVIDSPEGKKVVPIDQVPQGVPYRPQSPMEQKLIEDIEKEYREPALKVQDKVTRLDTAEDIIREINETLEADPEAATAGGWLAATTSKLARDAAGLVNTSGLIIQEVEGGQKDYYDGIRELDEISNTIRNLVAQGGPTERRALNSQLVEVNKRKLAYIMAAQEGQSGVGLSSKEYDTFYDQIGNGKEQIKQNTRTWFNRTQKALAQEVDAINNNPKAKRLKSTFGYGNDLVDFNPSNEVTTKSNPGQPPKDIQKMPSSSQEEQDKWYDSLPPGTTFIGPDGETYTKE